MVKRLKRSAVIAAVFLMVMMTFFCFTPKAYAITQHMYDDSGYLYDSEINEIDRYLTAMSDELDFDVVGVMISEGYVEDALRTFADDFYDYGGYGRGSEKDGVIFVVDMESRLMTVVTTGFGITAITDYGEELIYDFVQDDLRNGDFVSAYKGYADMVAELVNRARDGNPVDVDGGDREGYDGDGSRLPSAEAAAGMGGISLAAGAGAGFLSSQRQKSKLKTVRRKTQANSYARRDSLVLSRKQDRFLYRTVSAVPRPKNNNNNHHSMGGGTTIHMGSSGTPHGGGHSRGF